MNLNQFFIILWARKRIALWTLAMTVITTLVVSLSLPKQYVATTSIMVDQHSIDPVTGQNLPVSQLQAEYMATQAEVLASHNVARKVVENLKLIDGPQMQKDFPNMQEDFANAKYNGDIKDWVADILLENLVITPSKESSLIQVDFTSADPQLAANIANAFTDAYIQTNVDLRAQPAKLKADWFDLQLASLRERLEHSQSVLSSYQQQQGVVVDSGVDRQVSVVDIEQTRLSELSSQLVESQAHTNELQTRKDLLAAALKHGGSYESLQEVLNSPLIQQLKAELARSSAHLAELSQKFKKANPQYKQAEAQVISLQQDIKSATKMVLTSINSEVTSSRKRDEMLVKALTEQKAKILVLKKKYEKMEILSREVENAQKAYDEVLRRAEQTRMESKMNLADISILNAALPPQKAAKPNKRLNMIISFFLGSMLGVGAALLAELKDRRVRSAFDISEILAVPVFAVFSATVAKPKRMLRLFNLDKTSNSNYRGSV